MPTITAQPENLKQAWANLREENPALRIRNAAEMLGVSEAELLAIDCGETVTRLEIKNWGEFLPKLESLGRVMALTRNDQFVHERKGVYENLEMFAAHKMALFVNPDIDLRIFLKNWKTAFAVSEDTPRGKRNSLQIFDASGTAIHKIYLQAESSLESFEKIVETYRSENQKQTQKVSPKPKKTAEKPDGEIDVEGFRQAWTQIKDTHDFFPMLKKFGVARRQALRLADREMAYEVAPQVLREVLQKASERKLSIMIFVGNPGIIQIHTGTVERLLATGGEWYNVLDEPFNLHARETEIAAAYVVKKPTADGIVTSIEFFNDRDENIALFFGKRKPGIPEMQQWRDLVAELEKI
jgi:putative hemin transport protein